jgi:hypothetical protein
MYLQVEAAIGAARTLAALDGLAKDLWRAWDAKAVSDSEAERLSGQIEAARLEIRPKDTVRHRAPHVPMQLGASYFPPKRRRQVSPDRAASMERRRRLALSGPLPPQIACRFTMGQLAVLHVVANDVAAHGRCEMTMAEIAARAGVGERTARYALRLAAGDGLVTIEERRRRYRPNLANVVRIISREWVTWLARRGRFQERGCKKAQPTNTDIRKPSVYAEETAALRGDNAYPSQSRGQKGVFRGKRLG